MMTLDDIVTIIVNAHINGDPDSFDGLIDIFKTICDELNVEGVDSNFWSEEAMTAIAYAAFDASAN